MVLQLSALALVSLIAFLTKDAAFWIVAGAMAIFTGFYWYDVFVTTLGLAFGLCFIIYGLVCFSIAFRSMFSRDDEE